MFMDNDFPAVMANGGGKTFLSGFVKGMNKYSQAGTDVDDFEMEREYEQELGKPMMETVAEEKKQTGEVQDLSYTELRARLPNEISNEIVMLLANSKQALLDFANIQTGEDVANFNQQYDVNLTLPQGA